jgi:uncharacterized protein (TIGR02301 family)
VKRIALCALPRAARWQRALVRGAVVVCVLAGIAFACGPASAQAASDTKPYDEKLSRLAELLGSIHYLRELCGSDDGQAWRERMRELIDAEGATALRRARLTRSFNKGYRSYTTHTTCTSSHRAAISRFMIEGAQIAEGLVKSVP